MRRNTQKGITLVALVVTIVVLLILASITIGAVTSDNGILRNANDAKEQTEIAEEKEIVDRATIQAMGNNSRGNIVEDELQEQLDKITGSGKTEADDVGEEFEVAFTESKRYYTVDKDGIVTGPQEIVEDKSPGDITKDENGDDLKGDENQPYEIWCIEDLVAFSNMVNGSGIVINNEKPVEINTSTNFYGKTIELRTNLNFKSKYSYANSERTDFGDINGDANDGNTLMNEMTTGTGFRPIGQDNKPFAGTFYGKGNNIDNIYEKDTSILGFFGQIQNATICDLKISGMVACDEKSEDVGGIVGSMKGGKIKNCIVNVELEGNGNRLGGIVGWASDDLEIINCVNLNTITSSNSSAGGIVGMCEDVIGGIYNSYNMGEIKVRGSRSSGIVGSTNSNIEIINVYNKGNVTENGSFGRGGILGSNTSVVGDGNVYINNAYNLGNIIEDNLNWSYGAGAICGYPSSTATLTIENSFYKKGTCSVAVGQRKDSLYGVTVLEKIDFEDMIKQFNEYKDSNESQTSEWKYWKLGEDGYPTFE